MIESIIKIGWALLALYVMYMGLHTADGWMLLVIVVVAWAALRIVLEGADAVGELVQKRK